MNEAQFIIDEIDNATDNLEMVAHFLERAPSKIAGKWEAIAVHQALYGFLVCALEGTAPALTVYDKKQDSGKAAILFRHGVSVEVIAASFGVTREKVRHWLNHPHLIGIREALKRVKRPDALQYSDSAELKLTSDEEDAIERLIATYRNEFEHFIPCTWMADVSEMPILIRHVIGVIRFLALEANRVNYKRDDQEDKVRRALAKIEQLLDQRECAA